MEHYRTRYAGLPLAETSHSQQPSAAEAAWTVGAWEFQDVGGDFAANLARFVEHVDSTQVRALIVSGWEQPYRESADHVVAALVENAAAFPALRAIFLGDMPSERCEISWIKQADVTPLLEAFPLLERLEIRGGSGLRLRPVRHEALKVLRFESGGLPAGVVRAVGESEFPALEHLELWLGVSQYGGDATVADLAGILSGERLPALRRLGLQDSEIQDEIAAAVASAPIVARLEGLALSMGVLTDAGAEALLSGQPLTHLKVLDLHHHYLGEEMQERILDALPRRVNLADAVDLVEHFGYDDDDEWDESDRFVAVSE
ncbi:STM4015 family protein [Planomonospora sp. ID67723]|nr:STM4015 family protein [Planomonospora sp. ID67723]